MRSYNALLYGYRLLVSVMGASRHKTTIYKGITDDICHNKQLVKNISHQSLRQPYYFDWRRQLFFTWILWPTRTNPRAILRINADFSVCLTQRYKLLDIAQYRVLTISCAWQAKVQIQRSSSRICKVSKLLMIVLNKDTSHNERFTSKYNSVP
jgi:hypothetical protein